MSDIYISADLHNSIKQYLASGYQTMSITLTCCVCESKSRQMYSDSVANVTSESIDVCDVCGLTEQWAYGCSRLFFEGREIPEDFSMNQVLLGLLRKLIYFEKELGKSEELLIDVLLGKENLTDKEIVKLQEQVANMNRMNVIEK